MRIEEQDQWGTDFDWFCVDAAEEIGHFTTAGFKLLPKSVSVSGEELESAKKFFEVEAHVRCLHRIDSGIATARADWKGESREKMYLRSFVSMADRGLYSFDIETYLAAISHRGTI
jgi:hypothetical protein